MANQYHSKKNQHFTLKIIFFKTKKDVLLNNGTNEVFLIF